MTQAIDAGLVLDTQQLNKIKQLDRKDSNAGMDAAAEQFEALFIQQMMKTMRSAAGESEFFNSNAMRTYQSMFDQQMSSEMAGKGIGLAEQLVQQLQQKG